MNGKRKLRKRKQRTERKSKAENYTGEKETESKDQNIPCENVVHFFLRAVFLSSLLFFFSILRARAREKVRLIVNAYSNDVR